MPLKASEIFALLQSSLVEWERWQVADEHEGIHMALLVEKRDILLLFGHGPFNILDSVHEASKSHKNGTDAVEILQFIQIPLL